MARRSNSELSEATRTLLLAEARKAFARDGYAEAPIDAVVQAAGLTKGALYHHFGSKQGLFVAVLEALDAEITARIRAAAPPGDASRAALLAACRVFLEATLDAGVRRILLLDGPAVLGQRASRAYEAESSIAPLTEALVAMRAAGSIGAIDCEAAAHLLAGALDEGALWLGEAREPREALARLMATLGAMIDGLAGVPPRTQPRSTGSTSIDQRTRRAARSA